MKAKLVLWFSLLVLLLLVGWTIANITWAKSYDKTLNGVIYRLGTEHRDLVEDVTIHIKGSIKKSWTREKAFQGIIVIENEKLPFNNDGNEVSITFDDKGYGMLIRDADWENQGISPYGLIFMNEDKVAIAPFEHENGISKGWEGGNGIVMAAPAQSYDEGMRIAGELMKKFHPNLHQN
ncbi:hypothetical protein [Paenibacillus harenae]|uniref:hypothetical protein n=1 Tax=Paenibacillus harenae TaxID=306543 RepID=UPI0003FA8885|nr:hypothetical protein [Paenibacillus harenae]